MANLAYLREQIRLLRLSNHEARILSHARPAIQIQPRRIEPGESLAPNASRFSGRPHLPAGQNWPMSGRWPMYQLAQLRLSDIAPFDTAGRLPKQGLLSFWCEMNETPWGYQQSHRHGFRVTYTKDEAAELVAADESTEYSENQLEGRHILPECELEFKSTLTLPYSQWDGVYDDDRDGLMDLPNYKELLAAMGQLEQPVSRLLGHPNLAQDAEESNCQFVSNNVNCDGGRYDEQLADKLRPGIADWILLLQLDTDEDGPGWMWGDLGSLYFYVRKQDLAAAYFDRCWMILETS